MPKKIDQWWIKRPKEGGRRIPHGLSGNARLTRPRFSIDPLFTVIGHPREPGVNYVGRQSPIYFLAVRLRVDLMYIHRWLHRGMDEFQADAAAVILGYHPSVIWENWFSTALDDEHGDVAVEVAS